MFEAIIRVLAALFIFGSTKYIKADPLELKLGIGNILFWSSCLIISIFGYSFIPQVMTFASILIIAKYIHETKEIFHRKQVDNSMLIMLDAFQKLVMLHYMQHNNYGMALITLIVCYGIAVVLGMIRNAGALR